MTRLEDRQTLVAEISEACAAGARLAPACSLRAASTVGHGS